MNEVRAIQRERFRSIDSIKCNGRMGIKEIEHFCVLGSDEKDYIRDIFKSRLMSGRTYHKMLKVARTIADMDSSDNIKIKHIAEASALRGIEDALFGVNKTKGDF